MAGPDRPVVWSREARDDLSGIWLYYLEAAGPSVAENIVRNINDACVLLQDHPLAGRERSEVRAGLRSVSAKPHIVFYRVGAAGNAEILRVLDGRQDIEEAFTP